MTGIGSAAGTDGSATVGRLLTFTNTQNRRHRYLYMLTVIFRFALLGSFAGGGVFLVVRDLASAHSVPSLNAIAFAPIEALVAAVLASFLSVPFGSFPAAATGALYWFVLNRYTKRNPTPMFRFVLGGGVGLVTCTSFGLLFSFGDAPGAYSRRLCMGGGHRHGSVL
jgi:hypothetical protein